MSCEAHQSTNHQAYLTYARLCPSDWGSGRGHGVGGRQRCTGSLVAEGLVGGEQYFEIYSVFDWEPAKVTLEKNCPHPKESLVYSISGKHLLKALLYLPLRTRRI